MRLFTCARVFPPGRRNHNIYYFYNNMGLRNRTRFKEFRCFFITTTCYNFLHLLKGDPYFKIINDSITFLNNKYGAFILGYVLMPNHIHLILYFEKINRLSDYMRDFKKYTSGEIRRQIESESKYDLLEKLRFEKREQKFKVWQDRFDDVVLYSRKHLEIKLAYIHQNPVKAGLVDYPTKYLHSSAGYYEDGVSAPIEVLNYFEVM